MPFFIYQASDQNGRIKSGEIQAPDRAAALAALERERLTPLRLTVKGEKKSLGGEIASFQIFSGHVSYVDRILLTRHLSAVIKAGLSLHEALEILMEDAQKPIMKRILFDAKTGIERGLPISNVFENYPSSFSPVFVGLVRAGEKSGTLEGALQNLGEQLMRDYDLIKKVRQAMIYPAILLGASLGVIILLLTFLLPRLTKVFSGTQLKLPLITRFFVSVSDILSAKPLLTVLFFIILIAALIFLFFTRRGRAIIIPYFQRLPVSGELVKNLALARLTRTLKNLLKSGIGVLEALEITSVTVGNKSYEAALLEIREEIRKGASLSDTFRSRGKFFPHLLVSMIAVGERTGTLEGSLETLAVFYEEEVDRVLKTLVSLLEPILLVIMGLVVGGIALSILLPIYQLVGTFR